MEDKIKVGNNRASITKVFWLSVIVSVIAIGVLLILSIGANKASADTVEIAVEKDAFICSNRPTSNYGSYYYNYVGDYYSTFRGARGLWYFDIANNLPTDCKKVTKVTFSVQVFNYQTKTIRFYELTRDWKERNPNGVTWRRAGPGGNWNNYGGDYKSQYFLSWSTPWYWWGRFERDITTTAMNWINNPSENHGFIAIRTSGSYYARFYNREYSYYSPPTLIVEYESSVPKITLQPNPTDGKDTYIWHYYYKYRWWEWEYKNNNFGRRGYMTIGGYQYIYSWYQFKYHHRGLIEFSSSYLQNNIPGGIEIVKAELMLYREYQYRSGWKIYGYSLLTEWNEGSSTWSPQTGAACWQSPKYRQAPDWNGAQPNTDYDPTSEFSFTPQSGWNKVDITNTLIKWLRQPNKNLGLLLKSDKETSSTGGYARFTSSDGSASRRPKIVIIYKIAAADQTPPITTLSPPSPMPEGYYKKDDYTFWAQPGKKFTFTVQDDPFGEGMAGGGYTMYKIEDSTGTYKDWTKVMATSDPMTFDLDTLTVEDTYTIKYYSVDKAGNQEKENTTLITIDGTAPSAPTNIIFGTPYYEGSIFITPQTTLTIDGATDYGGNGNPVGFKTGDGYWSIDSGSTWNKVDPGPTFKINTEGDHTLWVVARDRLGNYDTSNYLSIDLTVDETPPITDDITIDGYVDTPNGRFVSYMTKFTIPGATDYCGGGGTPSGINRTEYRVDTGPWTTITLNQPFSISMLQGAHTIYYRSVDNVQNTETAKQVDIIVDNSPPPQTKLHFEDGTPAGFDSYLSGPKWYDSDNMEIYVNANTKFYLIAPWWIDYPAGKGKSVGYDYSEYRFGGGDWIQFTENITIPKSVLEGLGNGPQEFYFRSVDKLGNTYTKVLEMETIRYQGKKKYYVVFDNTPPVTEKMSPTKNAEGKGDWYPPDWDALYVTSEKKVAGSYATYFKMGTVTDPGDYNTGVKKVEWHINNTQPNEKAIWIEWKDYINGVKSIEDFETAVLQVGGEKEKIEITEGNWSIYYRAWDYLDNVEEAKHIEITVDDSPPISSYEILKKDGTPLTAEEYNYYAVGGINPNEYFASKDFKYKLSSVDYPTGAGMSSGIQRIEYAVWIESEYDWKVPKWTEYTTPIELTEEGKYIIYYRGIDNLNHEEKAQTLTIYVDTTSPAPPDIEVGEPSWVDPATYYLWVNTGKKQTPFEITNLKDPKSSKVLASGVVKAEYKVDDGAWTDSFFDVFYFANNDGEHTIYARAIDRVGNEGEVQSKVLNKADDLLYATVVFDSTPPATQITKLTVTPEDSGNVLIEWEVSDNNYDHINIYRIDEEGNSVGIATIYDKSTKKYTDTSAGSGTYKYRVAPADNVQNEAKGRTSTENLIIASGKNREFQVGGEKAKEPYLKVKFKTISGKQTFSAELLDKLPGEVDKPEGSDFTFWNIEIGNRGGTRAEIEAELTFYYGHLGLTSDLEDYIRVAYWDGHKWNDFTEKKIDKTHDEITITTTHFSIYGVIRAYSDLGVDISFKNNPSLEGTQNIIYAKVTNYGKLQGRLFDVDEEDVNVTFAIRNKEGGWTDLGYEIIDVKAGETKTISMVWENAEVTTKDGVEVQVKVYPKDSKKERDPNDPENKNNVAIEKIAVVKAVNVTTSFATNIVILAISAMLVAALSKVAKK